MRRFLLSLLVLFVTGAASSQYSLTITTYSQNFDGLGTVTASPAGGDLNNISATLDGWFFSEALANANTTITAGTGSLGTGDTYNFGAAAGANRTLGGLQSGTLNPTIGFYFTNNTGGTITSLAINYTGETWRVGTVTRSDRIDFQYSTDATSLTTGTWTDFDVLDYANPGQATGSGSIQHSSSISNTLSSLSIANGTTLFIRWNDFNASGADDGMGVNDFSFTATLAPANTITTGTVLTPPFVLTDCLDTETGTVDFTSTDVFAGGNVFTAQLSDDVGSFASPVNIGSLSLSGADPFGTINITIPAGTVGGIGYQIRVVSDNPAVIGSSSAAFTIVQQGIGGCASSNTDYYRSVATGNWGSVSTWESSPDNTNWISATLPPTYLANTIIIQNLHTVTVAASASADQVLIMGGGILEHTLGTFTIEDGTGADIDINGIFILSSTANAPMFNGAATCNVATGGILRVSATGLTGAGASVNSNNYVYQNASILEYTPSFAFSSSGVTFFPNVDAVTIPIFRTTNAAAILVGAGAGNNTIINGVFECNGSDVSWQLAGTKTFRNGIRGPGNVIAVPTSGKFIINGLTAVLGGAGSLIVPSTDGLEIGTPTTVTMISDKTITGNVSLLTDTYVELGTYNLTVSGTVSNATITSYVKTNGTGKLILNSVGSGFSGKLFPIGLTSINPIFISSGTPSDYSARIVEPITPPIYADLQAVLRTWYISSSVNTPSAIISFGYSFSADCGPLYSNTGPAELGVNIGGVWNIHETGLTPAAFPLVPSTFIVTPTMTIDYFNNPVTEFPFVIANNFAILSLDCIISTRAQKRNNTGIISWTVNSCAGVNNFEVQRSVNNAGFQTIGTVNPVANQTDFSFTDPALAGGTNLYRIKVNGFTGSSKYSNTVALIHNSNDILISSLAPNPVHNKAMLVVSSGRNVVVDFKVYNLSGSLVKQWQSNVAEGNNRIEVNLGGLSAGMYSVFASANGSTTISRFVKQ